MERLKIGLCGLVITLIFGGCATTAGNTPEAKRRAVLAMKNETLADLYNIRPGAKAKIAAAPGYAVFDNAGILFWVSAGTGYGVVQRKGAKPFFMKMAEIGVGVGLGIKDYRTIFIFHNKATLDKFINEGWEFGADADIAAKAGNKGGALGAEALLDGITIYQLTESGLAVQATIKGTKYWKDNDLN
jgi:lipid-binding SYLF domain-containing protein